MHFTDDKSVSSTYKVIYIIDMPLLDLFLAHIELFIIYMLYTDVKSVSSTYRVIYHVYMLFTASSRSVCSTYRGILYIYVYFIQPLSDLTLVHIELILHVYKYMPFTDLKSASSTYVLDF